ncbi:DsbA family protein [Veronia pacifica]|uniref:DSBA-like thioredoxin domain-containing protein n=1 Tax=Veronia pacifica TaxID=1080227 RepID=A0A1C3E7M0_9GAMM|nr:DsbA family protein [Veronia pacifica]ODA29223.1 hypothetical protein A8L45_22475 [Veronia pacifica]
MVSLVTPYLAKIFLSQALQKGSWHSVEFFRRAKGRRRTATLFLSIDDPYSYLLLQVLPKLQQRYDFTVEFRTVLNRQSDMFPASLLWDQNAFNDCHFTADLYQLSFPTHPPEKTVELKKEVTAQLLHCELQPGYLDNAQRLFDAYWFDETERLNSIVSPVVQGAVDCYRQHLESNEKLLLQKNHYLSGNLHYGGEWYWGIDRLLYFEQRMNAIGANLTENNKVCFNRANQESALIAVANSRQLENSDQESTSSELEMFWSLRSPYSYLGLVKAKELAERFDISLVIKPVLPMVMRRMQVPTNKKLYIIKDVKREAVEQHTDFGLICDPVGLGVERCYALYNFAQQQGKEIEFAESCARAAWAKGVNLAGGKGLQKIVESLGMSWKDATEHLDDDSWRYWAQDNLLELYQRGQWGVPTFSYGDLTVFGQDKLCRIEAELLVMANNK